MKHDYQPSRMQQMFDIVVGGLLRQNAQSLGRISDICLYRGLHGRKCAVGFLISDEAYHSSLEGENTTSQSVLKAIEMTFPKLTTSEIGLLYSMQNIHDSCEPHQWPNQFASLARRYNLTMPTLVQA